MHLFLYLCFMFVGALVGGGIGLAMGGGGMAAFLGGILGLVVYRLIRGSQQSAQTEQAERRQQQAARRGGLEQDLAALRDEVRELRRRLDLLEGAAVTPAAESPVATAAAATPEPVAAAGRQPDDATGMAPPVAEPLPVPPTAAAAALEPPAGDVLYGAGPAEPLPGLADEVASAPSMGSVSEPPAAPAMPMAEAEAPAGTDTAAMAASAATAATVAPETAAGFSPFAAAKAWLLGGNTLVRVGVVVLFFGLAFLLKFAAEHAVVPIEFRYIGIGLGALVALGLGWRLRERRHEYAMTLQGFGVAALYLTAFAAFRVHGLLPPGATLTILVGVCGLSAALAILQDARSMAVIGICGGFLAPVLASTGSGNHVALFSYYAILNAGIVAIAWFKAWRPLNVLGFLFTFGIGSLWGAKNYREELFASTEPFLLLFFAMYLLVTLLYARRRQEEPLSPAVHVAGERVDYVDGTLVFGTPLAAFGLQYLMVRDMALGSAFSALALGLIYLPLATLLYRRGGMGSRLLVESFLALGVVFASLAIPLGLDAKWTSAAWAAEGAGIFWIGVRQGRPLARAFALLLQFGSAVSLLLTLRGPGEENLLGLTPVLAGAFLGPVLVGLALLFTARQIRSAPARVKPAESSLQPLLAVAGLAFLDLALPMLLDQTWTGLALVAAGGVTFWWAAGFGQGAALAFGSLVQVLGALLFGDAVTSRRAMPLLNVFWLGSLLVAAVALVSGWRLRRLNPAAAPVALVALAWALLWWLMAGLVEMDEHLQPRYVVAGQLGLAVVTAWLLLLGGRRSGWRGAEGASLLLLPASAAMFAFWLALKSQPLADAGWLAWPLAIATGMAVLYRMESWVLPRVLRLGHGFCLLLTTGLVTWQGWWLFRDLGEPGSAWPVLGWALAPMAVIALLDSQRIRRCWPVRSFAEAYDLAALPIALGLWFWVFLANGVSDGSASPLPYLPLANPLDLASAGALLLLLNRFRRWPGTTALLPLVTMLLAATTFYWLNGVLLRTLHHWAGVPFDFDLMMRSTLVQASLSLFWASMALLAMLFATRRRLRAIWLFGGALMALVVAKLFLVDLAGAGSVERIVSFIGVGLLLLVIGYFSPVPPKRQEAS